VLILNIGIIGAGDVAKTLAVGLSKKHQVMISSRHPDQFQTYLEQYPNIEVGSFRDAALYGEILINALTGGISVEVLSGIHEAIGHKILIDVSNPLDFTKNIFQLSIANDNSLAEDIQKALPHAKVVKTLNMITARLMVDPALIKDPHDMFMCGNDPTAKQKVKSILTDDFGWQIIHDLGDIAGARAMEQLLPMWIKIWGNMGHALFNFHIVSNT